MEKLLVICGPTATGKTSLALQLSKLLEGEIISADSRQVYKGMDIGTGKGLKEDSVLQFPDPDLKKLGIGCYVIDGVKLWGYDVADPKEEFNVSRYIGIADKIIAGIFKRKKLPVLTGGTGFYIKGVVDGIGTAEVPVDSGFRKSLGSKNPDELFEILSGVDPIKSASLNSSDRKNPRRLIRAIEVAKFNLINETKVSSSAKGWDKNKVLMIGLKADKEYLYNKISKSVKERIKAGLEEEIRNLLAGGVTWNMQSMNTLGYREWPPYFEGKAERQEIIREWLRDENNYAKRQMTWFKKDERINWVNIQKENWEKEVVNLIKKWQNR